MKNCLECIIPLLTHMNLFLGLAPMILNLTLNLPLKRESVSVDAPARTDVT